MASLCNRPYPVGDCALAISSSTLRGATSERDTPLQPPDSAARRQWINGCLYVANSVADVTGRLTSASSSRPRTAVGSPPRRHRSEATAQPGLYADRVTLKSGTAKVLRSTRATESVSPLSSVGSQGTRQVSASPWFVLPRRTAARQGSLGCPPPRRDPLRGTSWRGDPCVRLPLSPGRSATTTIGSAHQVLECGEVDQRLTTSHPPRPFPPNGRGEAKLQQGIEVTVGSLGHLAQHPVQLVGRHRMTT
jgi:hypothetical protein